MAQFINAKEDLVTEAIDGVLAASGGTLARLDGYPHIKVVVRTDWDKTKVALVSGGLPHSKATCLQGNSFGWNTCRRPNHGKIPVSHRCASEPSGIGSRARSFNLLNSPNPRSLLLNG